MSKISYEIFGNVGELADFESGGDGITLKFKCTDAKHLSLAGRSYEITDGCVILRARDIPDGVHHPRLISKNAQVTLPPLEVRANRIEFPAPENITHKLSLRIARQNKRIEALEKELCELKKFIHGSTCF